MSLYFGNNLICIAPTLIALHKYLRRFHGIEANDGQMTGANWHIVCDKSHTESSNDN